MNIIHYQKSERESNFACGSKFGILSVVLSEVNCPKCQEAAQQNAHQTGGGLCAECGSPKWCHAVIGHDFVEPHPQVA